MLSDIRARNIALGLVVFTGLLVLSLAAWRWIRPSQPHVEVDRSRYPIVGIDLSSHNGIPDFDSIAASGVDFVYLKASEGVSFRDKAFLRNYAAARHAGLKIGAYHFFRFDCDGPGQARNFLSAIDQCTFDLPLAIDVEEAGNPAQVPADFIAERLSSLLALVGACYPNVVIYTNKTGDARFVRGAYDDIEGGDPGLWICSFTDPPLTRRPWLFWQHSHIGSVPGVKGKVDMNTFNGDSLEWQRALDRWMMQ